MATASICKDFVATNKKAYTDILKAVNAPRKIRGGVKTSQEVKRGAELLARFSFR